MQVMGIGRSCILECEFGTKNSLTDGSATVLKLVERVRGDREWRDDETQTPVDRGVVLVWPKLAKHPHRSLPERLTGML